MSTRYSLRQTPRKKEFFDGMVATPGRAKRRKSVLPVDSQSEIDDLSATESTNPAQATRRRTAKFVERVDGSDDETSSQAASTIVANESELKPIITGAKSNGHTNGNIVDFAKDDGKVVAELELPVDGWAPGLDPKVDYTGVKEFGGSLGTSAMMLGFPLLMWYMWIGATYYDGKFPLPEAGQSLSDFGRHLFDLCYTGAFPAAKAWAIYWGFLIFEAACYCWLPGVWAKGKPLRHDNNKQLSYFCSAYAALYFTIAVALALHASGLFKLYTIIDEFGPILSVAIISGYLVAIVAYVSAFARGKTHRMTGAPIYDFFMGAELNPRMFGILDFKMFFEVRLPWFMILLITLGAAARQYENYGYVSPEVCFLLLAHWLYTNACGKGEELIVTTWDMYFEKWGFMLIFWNMAGVPLSYCHCTIYLANHHPSEYSWGAPFVVVLALAYLFVYWVWDSANSQKNRFRAHERGAIVQRKAFPQVPWQTLYNPKTIKTRTGDAILVDGWYSYARKIHYTCDVFFATSWGLITGFKSPFPWFYPVFFCCMIAHRAARDIHKCRHKYGDAWLQYEKQVPYLFIPYVF